MPAIYFQKEFVDEGGLMSYVTDYIDLYRGAAGYVDKILKAAKQIGLTIAPNVLLRADKVIK